MFLNPWYGNQQGGQLSDVEVKQSFVPPSLTALQLNLDRLQASLQPGWTVHLLRDGRYFYCNHASQNSSWLPPMENWESGGSSLPYGWETATDKDGKPYFINHLNKTTSYDDPRNEQREEPPSPRDVDLVRDTEMGFGFVAGSEKPVIVRFVTDGGPSVDKLLPGDQILVINGEDVKKAPRDHVIQLVRSCKEKVSLIVCQPPLDNSSRKSALLSAAKKQRLKSNPARVRFAESVDINGISSLTPSHIGSSESTTPFMPNVLKVFLENGQTKSFKYDSSTTVDDVLNSLHQKLAIKRQSNFSLVVEHVKSLKRNKLTLLDPNETLSKIAARPGAQMLRCLYRITFVPRDAYDFLREDSVAFEYLYLQCCNDVIQERFSPELKYEMALRLAALHIHQHALNAGVSVKLSIKNIEKDFGLDRFIPTSLVESMKRKELRKVLSHFLKLHGNGPGQKQLTALQAKLHYMKIVSELPSYGAKCFSTYNSNGSTESVVLISPKFGVSQINSLKSTMPDSLCEMEQMTCVSVKTEKDSTKKVEISIKDPDRQNLMFNMDDRDADEMVLVLQGYFQLLTEKPLDVDKSSDRDSSIIAPSYHSRHQVATSSWNYIKLDTDAVHAVPQRFADFSLVPPYQQPPEGFQIPNGHISRCDMPQVINVKPQLDSNMNRTLSIYENDDFSLEQVSPQLKTISRKQPIDILKEDKEKSNLNGRRSDFHEARNVEVIKRVAEMHQMVEDAESYLSDADGETTDVESVRSDSYGKLKHSDSLLLLTHGQKLLPNNIEIEEQSGSDTDSQSTPGSSPAHKPEIKTSGSSFGLHSPDSMPLLEKHQDSINNLITQMENKSGLPYPFSQGSLYLDPDIIDLTMIPPPITPDEDGTKIFPPQLNTPPTPFADRESLDKQLQALEKDVGDYRLMTDTWDERQSDGAGSTDTDDTMSVSSMSSNSSTLKSSQNNKPRNPAFTLAALRQLGFKVRDGEDIDEFIANLSIPPPPEGSNELQSYILQREMGGEYDISAFIIPPPPTNIANKNRSSDIIRRLYEAKEGINKVVGREFHKSAERDMDISEMKVSSAQMQKESVIFGRVASLQKHFEESSSAPKLENTISPMKICNSVLSNHMINETLKQKTDMALTRAIEENNKALRYLEADPSSSCRTNSIKIPGTLKTNSNYSRNDSRKEDAGPPPPPRTSITRPDHLLNGKNFNIVQKQANRDSLSKSISQDNIPSAKGSPLRNSQNQLSFSNESLDNSPSSPSKRSLASSNDSLASSSSFATVKAFSPQGHEDPPALPPRPIIQMSFTQSTRESNHPQSSNGSTLTTTFHEKYTDRNLPPAVPSRVKKPNTTTLNLINKPSTKQRSLKPAAPQPPPHFSTLPSRKVESTEEKPRLPSKSSHSLRNNSLSRPSNTKMPNGISSVEKPLRTSSPKAPTKLKLVNGERFSEDLNDSIDSGSFDQDSLEETEEIEAMRPSSREAYRVTAIFIAESLKRLSAYAKLCKAAKENAGGPQQNEIIFNRNKDVLTSESRQFVTASKLFVKSATETEEVLLQALTNCVTILQKMVNLCEDMTNSTSVPDQTQGILAKVKDVTGIYILTVRAALSAAGRGMDHPCMNTLMAQATNLAGALTSLMRTLRVFSP